MTNIMSANDHRQDQKYKQDECISVIQHAETKIIEWFIPRK